MTLCPPAQPPCRVQWLDRAVEARRFKSVARDFGLMERIRAHKISYLLPGFLHSIWPPSPAANTPGPPSTSPFLSGDLAGKSGRLIEAAMRIVEKVQHYFSVCVLPLTAVLPLGKGGFDAPLGGLR